MDRLRAKSDPLARCDSCGGHVAGSTTRIYPDGTMYMGDCTPPVRAEGISPPIARMHAFCSKECLWKWVGFEA